MRKALIFLLSVLFVMAAVSPVFGATYHMTAYIGTDARVLNSNGSKGGLAGEERLKTSFDYTNFFTYEGHAVYLYDASLFDLGSSLNELGGRNVKAAIDANVVSTSWTNNAHNTVDVETKKGNVISYNAWYQDAKTDLIGLSLTGKNQMSGMSSDASISLKVFPCPAVDSVVLGGEQKSGRLQSLTVTLAQNPSYVITEHKIEIPGAAIIGAETIEHISDNEFLVVTLPFVTNNLTAKEYTYHVTAKDELGRALDYTGRFSVLPDSEAIGSIVMNDKYYRNENKAALVCASFDLRIADDPVSFEWYVKNSQGEIIYGYDPLGDNTLQNFELSVPGKYQMYVKVTDVWEGFDGAPSPRSVTYTKTFTVENSAPKISIGTGAPSGPIKLGLALINFDGDVNEISEALRDQNIIANIGVGVAPAAGSGESFTVTETASAASTLINGREDELAAFTASPFPVFDINGNIHYYIEPQSGGTKLCYIKDLDGTKIKNVTLANKTTGRTAFGLELEHGTIVLFYLGNASCNADIVICEIEAGSNEFDNFTLPDKDTFTKASKIGNEFILTYKISRTKNGAEKYVFSPSYLKCVSDVTSRVFSDDNDLNLIYNFETDSSDINKVISECKESSPGSSGPSTSGQNPDGSFTFTYFDLEGDPFLKAWYEYNGKTVQVDSLTIKVNPVPGANEIKYYVMDDCKNPSYNKKSNVITVYLDGKEPATPDEPAVQAKYLLHRLY